jgi:penicillin-binding protein 1A
MGDNEPMQYDPRDDPDATLPHAAGDEAKKQDAATTETGRPAGERPPTGRVRRRRQRRPPFAAAAVDGAVSAETLASRRRFFRWTAPIAAAVILGALTGLSVAALIHMPRVDALAEYNPGLISELRDENGEVFASFARQRRVLLDENEVPEVLAHALIAVEDSNFYSHGGIDLAAIVRAELANLRAGEIEEGAGTITMQLARTLFLTREQTLRRKIEEAFLAVELEKNYSKQQLLTMYMNLMNVSHGNYGFAAAARDYFDKDVGDLELHEAAMLAGIVQIPSRFSPYRRPDLVRKRRDHVLRRMFAEGYVDRPAYEAAIAEPLGVVAQTTELPLAPYFAEDLRQQLESTFGTDAVHDGGLQVWTTLDADVQRAAETSLSDGLLAIDHRKGWRGAPDKLEEGEPESADLDAWAQQPIGPGRWVQGIVLESTPEIARVRVHEQVYELTADGIEWTGRKRPSDLLSRGEIAWFRLEAPEGAPPAGQEAESEEAETADEPERAAAAVDPAELRLFLEQPPDVQGAVVVLESATGAVRAMVGGWDFERSEFNRARQAKRQIGSAMKPFVYGAALEMGYTPADTIFDAPTGFLGADQKISYWPRNHSRRYGGIVTLRYALEHSINVPAVKLLDMIGVERVIDFSRRCGITSELYPYPSLALGAAEITPLELAGAYAAIANQGTWVEPYTIERVESANGEELLRHTPVTRTATAPQVAYVLTHMLEGTVDRGTAVSLRDLPLDLAGKTGTTDDYSDAWFVGFSPRYTMLVWVGYDVKKSLGSGMTGSRAALPIWRQIAEHGVEAGWLREGESFTPPPGLVFEQVEYKTGQLPGAAAQAGITGGVLSEAFLAGSEPVQSSTPRSALVIGLPWYQQRPFYLPKEGENMTQTTPDGDDDAGDDGDDDAGDDGGGDAGDDAGAG